MIQFFRKPWRFALCYAAVLLLACGWVLLDAFVIPRREAVVADAGAVDEQAAPVATEPVWTERSYQDGRIAITIEETYAHGTAMYIADIRVSDPTYLRTALAQNTYGRNIKETTSAMAAAHDAVFAINGDYYGFRDTGYVLRNGTLYRSGGNGEALVIDGDGDFAVVAQDSLTDAQIADAWQILSFGPALVRDGEIAVSERSEVAQARGSNPRTAIGQAGPLHYIVIVSDGRTSQSEGLTLLQLAEVFVERGAHTAYNLDGGGSSTMVFGGEVINNPTNGRSGGERSVSDIVYFGYE